MPKHKDDQQLVVLMDGTHCFFEMQASNPRLAPYEKRMVWVRAIEVFTEKQGELWSPNDRLLAEAMMDARLYEPRERDGERLPHDQYLIAVNLRALRSLVRHERYERYARFATEECAAFMFTHHHGSDKLKQFTVYKDMLEFVNRLTSSQGLGARLIMVSTQPRANIDFLFENCSRAADAKMAFAKLLTRESFGGLEKTMPEFWEKAYRLAGTVLERTIVIGSNGISDGYAAKSGVYAVYILDRDSFQEGYFVSRQLTTRGVVLVEDSESLPRGRHFSFLHELGDSAIKRLMEVKSGIMGEDGNGLEAKLASRG